MCRIFNVVILLIMSRYDTYVFIFPTCSRFCLGGIKSCYCFLYKVLYMNAKTVSSSYIKQL